MKRKKIIPRKKRSSRPAKHVKNVEPVRTSVYIIGDPQLVEEFGDLCTSRGFFVYYDFNAGPGYSPQLDSKSSEKTTTAPRNASFALELTNVDLERKQRNVELLDRSLPASTAIVSSSITVSATEQASWIQHKSRLVGCSALPSFGGKPLIEIAPTVFSPAATVTIVQKFFESIGKEIELVQDRVGMVFPRIVCQLINEAAFALQEEVAKPRDIDTAMKTAAKYPMGPIEWGDRIGLEQVVAILNALHNDLGEDRYRTAPLLRQMAASGTWWHRAQALHDERHTA